MKEWSGEEPWDFFLVLRYCCWNGDDEAGINELILGGVLAWNLCLFSPGLVLNIERESIPSSQK